MRRERHRNQNLTPRERDIARLISLALTNREMAKELKLSPNTVSVHLRNVFFKLGCRNRTEVAIIMREAV